jgi:hypothetical protein
MVLQLYDKPRFPYGGVGRVGLRYWPEPATHPIKSGHLGRVLINSIVRQSLAARKRCARIFARDVHAIF